MTPSGQTEPGQRQRQRQRNSNSGSSQQRRRVRPGDDIGVIPVLARAAREVETAVQKGPLKPANRARFQVATLLLREERARVKADKSLTDAERANEQKRLDGLAGILARQADELREAYAPWLALEGSDEEDGWILLTARKP